MQLIHEENLAAEPMSQMEQDKIRRQLERLLETHHFKNSRRYPALLRFIVEETLAGRGEYLKERLLGVRVFDRPADYDTAADPVVRVTIAEIRKRIAQYYHDEAHDAEMRIELLPGRYAPEFRARSVRVEAVAEDLSLAAETREVAPAAQAVVAVSAPESIGHHRGASRGLWILVAAGFLVGLLSFVVFAWARPTLLEELWGPMLASGRPVLFCVPTGAGRKHGPLGEELEDRAAAAAVLPSKSGPGRTFLDYEVLGQNIVYSDMLAATHIVNVLAVHHRDYRFRLNVETTLEDLRQGPAVLVGGLDNQWTMRSLAPLRFHFLGNDEDAYWVADAEDAGNRSWSLDLKQQYGTVTRDYAIVARLHNEQSGQVEMIVAGIGMSGTSAAGEFLTDPERMKELRRRVGAGFKDHDFEVVLSTDVVNGIPGSPKILAVAVW